jgi:hypothetical protein
MAIRKHADNLRMLENPDARRWYNSLCDRSKVTADNYLRTLGLFCERTGTTPATLVAMNDEDRDDLVEDYIHTNRNGAAPVALKAIKS